MDESDKVVRDPIHGNIKLKDSIAELLESPEVQRLYNIKQLGFAHLVFPGAHHTRLEHSLGAYHIASQISETLNIGDDERDVVACAALLHDIGHGPFSHTLESILLEKFGVDHVKNLSLGNMKFLNQMKKILSNLKVYIKYFQITILTKKKLLISSGEKHIRNCI